MSEIICPNIFKIQSIGEGATSQVYKCRRVIGQVEQIVAVKVFKDKKLTIDDVQNEAKLIAKLNHPNIAKFIDIQESADGYPCIIFEYIDGLNLKEYLEKNRKLSNEKILFIYSSILSAIEYSHKNGIVHGDIKPSNILISYNNEIKLSDFGSSQFSSLIESNVNFSGTLNYSDPYIVKNKIKSNVDSDYFALNLILFEMATNKQFFNRLIPSEAIEQLLEFDHVDEYDLEEISNNEIKQILINGLKFEQNERELVKGKRIQSTPLFDDNAFETIKNFKIKKKTNYKKISIYSLFLLIICGFVVFKFLGNQEQKPILYAKNYDQIEKFSLLDFNSYTNSLYSNLFCDNIMIFTIANIERSKEELKHILKNEIDLIETFLTKCSPIRFGKFYQFYTESIKNKDFVNLIKNNSIQYEPDDLWDSLNQYKDMIKDDFAIWSDPIIGLDIVYTNKIILDDNECDQRLEMYYLDQLLGLSNPENQVSNIELKILMLPKKIFNEQVIQIKGMLKDLPLIEVTKPELLRNEKWCYGEISPSKKKILFDYPKSQKN